ncbi:MAG: hypothetical protein QXG39_06215 [Candidatus Aenigmatarchaeota archaeon]
MGKSDYWIQEAIEKPGSLKAYVKRKYGKRGFTRSPKTGKPVIKRKVLVKLAKRKDTIGRRARLALTLRRLRRR